MSIQAQNQGKEVELSVGDRGPGLKREELEKVFDLFYQGGQDVAGPEAGTVRKGYGIGLAICKAIVQVHGGRIWAENREGGGALFRLTLPVPGRQRHIAPPAAQDEAKEDTL